MPSFRPSTPWLTLAAAVAAAVTYTIMRGQVESANERAEALQSVVTSTESTLLGQTAYTRFLQEGKKKLTGQRALLTAKVRLDNAVTLVLDKTVLGFRSSGTVAVWYSVEYAFGYDLNANAYDVRATDHGIAIEVGRVRLVATPAVTNLRYKVLSGGLLTDEKEAALRLYAEASRRAQVRGRELASEPAIVALCEKQLRAFLRDFLARQPGVRLIPDIEVVYRT
jgi:hypothetical protein